jgi:hypothetical protein
MSKEFIKCLICGELHETLGAHLRAHNTNSIEYRKRFPNAATFTSELSEKFAIAGAKSAGHTMSEEGKRSMALANSHPASKETCELLSKNALQMWQDEDIAKKISDAHKVR